MTDAVTEAMRNPTFNSVDSIPVLGQEFPVVAFGSNLPAITDSTKDQLSVSYARPGSGSPGQKAVVVHANTADSNHLVLTLRIDDRLAPIFPDGGLGTNEITITITLTPEPPPPPPAPTTITIEFTTLLLLP